MAKAWTKVDWNEELSRIARDAAKSMMEKKDLTGYSKLKIEAIQNEYIRDAKKKLKEKYPFDKLKDTEKDAVSNLKGEDAAKFLGLTGGNDVFMKSYDPLLKKKMDDFAKLGPLVLGLADEGRDWYNMGATDLFAKGEELGYDTKSKKGKMDFLSDISDVQQAHDRGKLLEEFNRKSNILNEMYYPTMMEEFRKQITTGRGTQEQLDEAQNTDILFNLLIGAAPALGDFRIAGPLAKAAAASKLKPLHAVGKAAITASKFLDESPVISGSLGSLGQGALEAERQYYKEGIDPELEADYKNALIAFITGATRPGMIGTASALSQQLPGENMARFAEGISAATRRGNPVYAERERLGRAYDIYDKLFKNAEKGQKTAANAGEEAAENAVNLAEAAKGNRLAKENIKQLIGTNGTRVKLSDLSKGKAADKFKEQVNALYSGVLNDEEYEKMLAQGTKDKILSDYDKLSKMTVYRDPANTYNRLGQLKDYELVNGNELRPGNYLDALGQAFPAKMAEAYGNDNWYRTGLRAGQILGTLGGSIEPVLKANPFALLSGGNVNMVNTDYKETLWYKSLSKKQQEAFDDAYEKSKRASE